MRRSRVLAQLRAGKVARVCSLTHFLPFFPRMAAHFGFDGVWVDGEHRAFEARETQALLAFHHLADIDCLWRPATLEKAALTRLLEDGATGLMIPHVPTAGRAQQLVQAVKFPPLGDRGLDGANLDADFHVNPAATYPQDANRETFLVAQIETPEALGNAEAIAAVPGVDVLFLGPGDLSLRLGCRADAADPQMMDAQKRVAAAARKHGKVWGRPAGTVAEARVIMELGARLLAYGGAHRAVFQHLQSCQADLEQLFGGQP